MKKEFQLPHEDVEYLKALGLPWEAICERNARWLIIHQWPIPSGYTISSASIALRIEPNYPAQQIDMAYFYPFLVLRSKKNIERANVIQQVDGKNWQRWSRHRKSANCWVPGDDDISTHLTLVDYWLRQETPQGVKQ